MGCIFPNNSPPLVIISKSSGVEKWGSFSRNGKREGKSERAREKGRKKGGKGKKKREKGRNIAKWWGLFQNI